MTEVIYQADDKGMREHKETSPSNIQKLYSNNQNYIYEGLLGVVSVQCVDNFFYTLSAIVSDPREMNFKLTVERFKNPKLIEDIIDRETRGNNDFRLSQYDLNSIPGYQK